MNKIIKQLFLFLIPTLIVMLISVTINQQNIFVTDDSDGGTTKIEQSTKNIDHNIFPLSYVINSVYSFPILTVNGNLSILVSLLNDDNIISVIKNRSPPINIIA